MDENFSPPQPFATHTVDPQTYAQEKTLPADLLKPTTYYSKSVVVTVNPDSVTPAEVMQAIRFLAELT